MTACFEHHALSILRLLGVFHLIPEFCPNFLIKNIRNTSSQLLLFFAKLCLSKYLQNQEIRQLDLYIGVRFKIIGTTEPSLFLDKISVDQLSPAINLFVISSASSGELPPNSSVTL